MPKSKKRAASSDSSSDSGPEDRVPQKKAPEKKAKSDKSSGDGEKSFAIDKRKFVKVREFRGTLYVDIREYYEKDGDMLPGKKGIALSTSNWNKLKDLISDIDDELSKH